MTDTIRSYISIELPENVRTALLALHSRLKKVTPPQAVRWSAPDNIHLTLYSAQSSAQQRRGKPESGWGRYPLRPATARRPIASDVSHSLPFVFVFDFVVE